MQGMQLGITPSAYHNLSPRPATHVSDAPFPTFPARTVMRVCRYYQVFKEMIWPGAFRNEMQLPPLSRCPVRRRALTRV